MGSPEALLLLERSEKQGNLDYQLLRVLPGIDTGRPVFSPAGDTLAYLDWQSGLRIVSLSEASGADVVIPVDHNSPSIRWTADGASILFANRSGIHIVNRDGSGLRVLSELRQYESGLRLAGT